MKLKNFLKLNTFNDAILLINSNDKSDMHETNVIEYLYEGTKTVLNAQVTYWTVQECNTEFDDIFSKIIIHVDLPVRKCVHKEVLGGTK